MREAAEGRVTFLRSASFRHRLIFRPRCASAVTRHIDGLAALPQSTPTLTSLDHVIQHITVGERKTCIWEGKQWGRFQLIVSPPQRKRYGRLRAQFISLRVSCLCCQGCGPATFTWTKLHGLLIHACIHSN